VSRSGYRERIDERLRLMQVYEVMLRYAADGVFDRGVAGDARRSMQSWLYRTEVEELTAPQKVRLLLEELGPTYVKVGQIVASRSDTLPAEWERELTQLQSHVPPFSTDEAREVIRSELGAPPEELFEKFAPLPFAAASLAQVHRATLEDGREVVVKVQRPNIESRVRADLSILGRAARVAERRSATARESGAHEIVEEFGSALLLELDYRIEAYNARRLAQNLAPLPGVAVPGVVRALSRRRVLTMDFVEGVEANDREAILAAGLDPTEIADNAVRAAIKMILVDGFFHADPHPGNVLVDLDTGVLSFIDTGMVGELDLRQRLHLVSLLYTSTKSDPAALARSLRSVSKPFRDTDAKSFDASFVRQIGPLMDVGDGQRLDLSGIISASLELLREAGYRPDPQLSLAMKALTQAAEFMKVLYPPGRSGEFATKAIEMTRQAVAEELTEDRLAEVARRQATLAAGLALEQLPSLQEATGMWLRQYRKGRFEVKVDTSDLEPRMRDLRDIARNLTLGLIVTGVLIASAVAATAPDTGAARYLRGVGQVVAIVALVIAAVLVVALSWKSLRRERPSRGGSHPHDGSR
jgi:ubiquinone biosynthesis protein